MIWQSSEEKRKGMLQTKRLVLARKQICIKCQNKVLTPAKKQSAELLPNEDHLACVGYWSIRDNHK